MKRFAVMAMIAFLALPAVACARAGDGAPSANGGGSQVANTTGFQNGYMADHTPAGGGYVGGDPGGGNPNDAGGNPPW